MRKLFAVLPNIGALYFHYIYLYCNGAKYFSCKTMDEQYYFVIAIPSGDENTMAWLAVQVSDVRLYHLEKEWLDMREAFTEPESDVLRIELVGDDFSYTVVDPQTLPETVLPAPRQYLYAGRKAAVGSR